MYSGHKRAHGMKFQSVVTPDGFFACIFGAVNGNRHDLHMLNESLLLPRHQDLMPGGKYREQDVGEDGHNNEPVYLLYADPAYPQLANVFGGFRNPAPGSHEAL